MKYISVAVYHINIFYACVCMHVCMYIYKHECMTVFLYGYFLEAYIYILGKFLSQGFPTAIYYIYSPARHNVVHSDKPFNPQVLSLSTNSLRTSILGLYITRIHI